MLANDMKKGMRVKLKNGWFGTVNDNKKGNIRDVDVEGDFRETGSVYVHDIALVRVDPNASDYSGWRGWEPVTLSPAQEKSATLIKSMGF